MMMRAALLVATAAVVSAQVTKLDQLKGATVKLGPGMKGIAKNLIDLNTSPNSWTKSPNGASKSCTDPRYVTIDLGNYYQVSSIRVWKYYADGRKCKSMQPPSHMPHAARTL